MAGTLAEARALTHTMWQVPWLGNFLAAFHSKFGLAEITTQDLEESLINPEDNLLCAEILLKLLRGVGRRDGPVTQDNWMFQLRDYLQSKCPCDEFEANPLANALFHEVDIPTRVDILMLLVRHRWKKGDLAAFIDGPGVDIFDFRLEAIGHDGRHRHYYYSACDLRIYVETWTRHKGARAPPEPAGWDVAAETAEEMLELHADVRKVKGAPARDLARMIKQEILPHAEPLLQERARRKERKLLREIMPRKRSSRLARKQAEQEEEERRLEEERRAYRAMQRSMAPEVGQTENTRAERARARELALERARQAELAKEQGGGNGAHDGGGGAGESGDVDILGDAAGIADTLRAAAPAGNGSAKRARSASPKKPRAKRPRPRPRKGTAAQATGAAPVYALPSAEMMQAAAAAAASSSTEDCSCIGCGLGDIGTMMICCDTCNVWYHVACIGMQPNALPETYQCRRCTAKAMMARVRQNMPSAAPRDPLSVKPMVPTSPVSAGSHVVGVAPALASAVPVSVSAASAAVPVSAAAVPVSAASATATSAAAAAVPVSAAAVPVSAAAVPVPAAATGPTPVPAPTTTVVPTLVSNATAPVSVQSSAAPVPASVPPKPTQTPTAPTVAAAVPAVVPKPAPASAVETKVPHTNAVPAPAVETKAPHINAVPAPAPAPAVENKVPHTNAVPAPAPVPAPSVAAALPAVVSKSASPVPAAVPAAVPKHSPPVAPPGAAAVPAPAPPVAVQSSVSAHVPAAAPKPAPTPAVVQAVPTPVSAAVLKATLSTQPAASTPPPTVTAKARDDVFASPSPSVPSSATPSPRPPSWRSSPSRPTALVQFIGKASSSPVFNQSALPRAVSAGMASSTASTPRPGSTRSASPIAAIGRGIASAGSSVAPTPRAGVEEAATTAAAAMSQQAPAPSNQSH